MLLVLFQRISHGVCEPLAVGALLGIGFFLYLHWKKSRSETLLFAGLLLFMVGWRVALKIISDRYALFLVPFAIFFTVWGIKLVAGWGRRLLPRVPWAGLWAAGLLITAVCISFAHHEEDRAFFTLLKVFRQEIKDIRTPVILWSNRDFSVFLDPRVRSCIISPPERMSRELCLSDMPEYALFRYPRKAFHQLENIRGRKLIARVDGGGRRKFSYGLWKIQRRFLRLETPSEVEKYAVPETGNLLSNAGFEIVRPPQETALLTKRYVGMGADFYRKPGLLLPAAWSPAVRPEKNGTESPEFELCADAPIRGRYSLRIRVSPKFPREIFYPKPLSPGDYRWSMLVRAKKDARFRLYFHMVRNNKYLKDRNVVFCTIPADGTYFLSVPVDRAVMTNGDKYFAAIGGLSGELFVDEVSLVPLSTSDKR